MKSRGKRRTGGHILNTLLIGLLLIDPVSAETHQEVQYWRRYYGLPAQEFDLGLTLVARQHAASEQHADFLVTEGEEGGLEVTGGQSLHMPTSQL